MRGEPLKPQWEKNQETLQALRKQLEKDDEGRRAIYKKDGGLTVTMWSGAIIDVAADDCTAYVAATLLDIVRLGDATLLELIFRHCTLFQVIVPTKGSKTPLVSFI